MQISEITAGVFLVKHRSLLLSSGVSYEPINNEKMIEATGITKIMKDAIAVFMPIKFSVKICRGISME